METVAVGLELLTADELAARWRVTRGHVYELVRTGALKAVRVGRSLRIPASEAEAFLVRGGSRGPGGGDGGGGGAQCPAY